MAMELGYNINKSKELIESISSRYNALGAYISGEWDHVEPIMRREWVGPDEIAYEAKLVGRINELYNKSYELAKAAVTTVVNLTNSWIDFQRNNIVQNENGTAEITIESTGLSYIEDPGSLKQTTAIEWAQKQFTGSEDLGLRTATSKATILSTVDRFVKNVQNRATQAFDEITLNNAFFGSQQDSLKKYVTAVGTAIGEVTTAVNELGQALEQLANTNYTSADTSVSDTFTTETDKVSTSVETELKSRWTSSN